MEFWSSDIFLNYTESTNMRVKYANFLTEMQ